MNMKWKLIVLSGCIGGMFLSACTHKIEIIPSDKPIIINLNVKIDQEIRVRLDKDIEDLLADNPDIF
ncbi:MAG: hypothetical protein COA69_05625 [Robiginitomaculum sp.]|nr:MAG: hypothetical protein COA69_05625 [Robiginitomaculum sp.]